MPIISMPVSKLTLCWLSLWTGLDFKPRDLGQLVGTSTMGRRSWISWIACVSWAFGKFKTCVRGVQGYPLKPRVGALSALINSGFPLNFNMRMLTPGWFLTIGLIMLRCVLPFLLVASSKHTWLGICLNPFLGLLSGLVRLRLTCGMTWLLPMHNFGIRLKRRPDVGSSMMGSTLPRSSWGGLVFWSLRPPKRIPAPWKRAAGATSNPLSWGQACNMPVTFGSFAAYSRCVVSLPRGSQLGRASWTGMKPGRPFEMLRDSLGVLDFGGGLLDFGRSWLGPFPCFALHWILPRASLRDFRVSCGSMNGSWYVTGINGPSPGGNITWLMCFATVRRTLFLKLTPWLTELLWGLTKFDLKILRWCWFSLLPCLRDCQWWLVVGLLRLLLTQRTKSGWTQLRVCNRACGSPKSVQSILTKLFWIVLLRCGGLDGWSCPTFRRGNGIKSVGSFHALLVRCLGGGHLGLWTGFGLRWHIRKRGRQRVQMGFPGLTCWPFRLRQHRHWWTCTKQLRPANHGPLKWQRVLSRASPRLQQLTRWMNFVRLWYIAWVTGFGLPSEHGRLFSPLLSSCLIACGVGCQLVRPNQFGLNLPQSWKWPTWMTSLFMVCWWTFRNVSSTSHASRCGKLWPWWTSLWLLSVLGLPLSLLSAVVSVSGGPLGNRCFQHVASRRVVPCRCLAWRWWTGCWIGGWRTWMFLWICAPLSMTGVCSFVTRMHFPASGLPLKLSLGNWIWLWIWEKQGCGLLMQGPEKTFARRRSKWHSQPVILGRTKTSVGIVTMVNFRSASPACLLFGFGCVPVMVPTVTSWVQCIF